MSAPLAPFLVYVWSARDFSPQGRAIGSYSGVRVLVSETAGTCKRDTRLLGFLLFARTLYSWKGSFLRRWFCLTARSGLYQRNFSILQNMYMYCCQARAHEALSAQCPTQQTQGLQKVLPRCHLSSSCDAIKPVARHSRRQTYHHQRFVQSSHLITQSEIAFCASADTLARTTYMPPLPPFLSLSLSFALALAAVLLPHTLRHARENNLERCLEYKNMQPSLCLA